MSETYLKKIEDEKKRIKAFAASVSSGDIDDSYFRDKDHRVRFYSAFDASLLNLPDKINGIAEVKEYRLGTAFDYNNNCIDYFIDAILENGDVIYDVQSELSEEYKNIFNSAEKLIIDNIISENESFFKNPIATFEHNNIEMYFDEKKIEDKTMNNETLADKYNRMEKFFEGKYCNDFRKGDSFAQLYESVKKEFPNKTFPSWTDEKVLENAVSRIIYENIDFNLFSPDNYDVVYDVTDGYDQRCEISDKLAELLITNNIKFDDFNSLKNFLPNIEKPLLKEIKDNNPDMQVIDRINSAFNVASRLYPGIEFAGNKKVYIEKAFDSLKTDYEEKILNNELEFFELEALVKGLDAVRDGEKSLSYIRPNAEEMQIGSEEGWKFDEFTKGYALFQNSDSTLKGGVTPKFISKIDDMGVFESDGEAAVQWEKDTHGKLIQERESMWIGDEDLEYYSYPDTPENRAILKENGWLLEHPLKFDFSEFTENDFYKIKNELLKDRPNEDYYGRLHIGSIHVEFVINQPDGWVDTNYYILGEKDAGEAQFGVPYDYFPGKQVIANLFTENTYEEFKEKVSKAVLEDIATVRILKTEAMRPLVDWSDEKQCKELYRTKLVESARENEIVIAPYSQDSRDMEAVRSFIASIDGEPAGTIQDDVVMAVIDNIGKVQDSKAGDFLKLRKDGAIEHISALGHVEKEPLEILSIINSFAENHAAVSEDHSQQRKDYEKINSLYKKAYEKHMRINDNGFNPSEYVLNKLKEKGIEVITDKEEFNRILGSQNIVQKMSGKKESEENPLFLADEKEVKAFAQKLDDWSAGKLPSGEIITEFSTSIVLQALNIPANNISIEQLVLKKINSPETIKVGNSYGHDIDLDTIKQIPQFLADPIMVYNSATRPDSYTVLTEAVDKNKESILIALQINKIEDRTLVNNITSAYGKDENEWFIEQIKEGNLVYQDKRKSLEWSSERRLCLPNQSTIQSFLNVIQKEDIVNKRTINFDLSERNIEFTENQQQFLKSIGFENSLSDDGNLSRSSFCKKDSVEEKHFLEIKRLAYYEGKTDNIGIYERTDSQNYLIETNTRNNFFEFSLVSMASFKEQFVPVEDLGKVLSDYALERLVSVDDELMEKKFEEKPDSMFVENDLKNQLEEISFKNKVSNIPAIFVSEKNINSDKKNVGKQLTFELKNKITATLGINLTKKNHCLLIEFQTDDNYNLVENKNYPCLYEAKWNHKSQSYTDKTELTLKDFDSKTQQNIKYVAANNCHRNPVQTMTLSDGITYGFTHNGKIYLNPDVMNSETAVHEYTHLWDNLTRKDNPELWNKGLKIFKGTSLWNEVINDSHYQDIKDDENLVLSECHARICGRVADSVLNHIAELDGNEKQAEMIDWDKETIDFIFENYRDIFSASSFNSVAEFTASAMKNLFNPLAEIKKETPNIETLSFIKEVLEKESGIRVDEKIAGEIYSRYQDHDLNLELEYYPNGTFRAYDYEGGKYTNPFKIGDAVEQVLSWNEKELSELHAGTADDKEIAEIKKINGELERICGQIACNGRLAVLDSADEKSVGKVKKFLEDDGFKVERDEAKTLLAFASDFHDGTSEYAVNDNNQLYFRTSNDNEGWSFISENDHEYGYEIIANAFEHALNLLDSSQKDHVQTLRSFVQKNREILSDDSHSYGQDGSVKEFMQKLESLEMPEERITVTHSVTFPCGFIFPKEIYENDPGESKREEYRWKIYEKIKEKFGFHDNDTETEYFKGNIPSESSFNIHFAVSVPDNIKTDAEKVDAWIKDVEKFVKEECGCTFINWTGGERLETVYGSRKQYRMEEERIKDFAQPNTEDLHLAKTEEIIDYCKISEGIDLAEYQAVEVYNFYHKNSPYELAASPAGNLYIHDFYNGKTVPADAELLVAGHNLRSASDHGATKTLDYLMEAFDGIGADNGLRFKELLSQISDDKKKRLDLLSEVLADSFETLERHDEFWKALLDYGANPAGAVRIAAEDANLGDNLNWLLDNIPESRVKEIFSDKAYAEEVYDTAKKSVAHDIGSWTVESDIGFAGFKRIAVLCGQEKDADRFYGECLEKSLGKPVEPNICQLLDTPELLAEKMNSSRLHENAPEISLEQARAILDYCSYEYIRFYCGRNGEIYSLDVSEDYNGEGLREDNFGILANGMEYADKAKAYGYKCYTEDSYRNIKELWDSECAVRHPENLEKKNLNKQSPKVSGTSEKESSANSLKAPVEIIREIAFEKEKEEVPGLFKNEFRSRIKTSHAAKDPFIIAKAILNEWKSSRSEYIPILNDWLCKKGCTSKERFENFFRSLGAGEREVQKKDDSRLRER